MNPEKINPAVAAGSILQNAHVENTANTGNLSSGPDIEQAQRFLTLLDETADAFTFQVFKDHPDAAATPDIYNGSLTDLSQQLTTDNLAGAGVYVTINQTDLNGRKKDKNMVGVRAVFEEQDNRDAPRPEYPIEPHIEVESSPGKYHRYWLCDGLTLAEWSGIQQGIVNAYGSDQTATEGHNRVLRVPGFFHQKDPNNPFMVRIVSESLQQHFTADQIRAAFPPGEKPTNGKKRIKGNGKAPPPSTTSQLSPEQYALAMKLSQQAATRTHEDPHSSRHSEVVLLGHIACREGLPAIKQLVQTCLDTFATNMRPTDASGRETGMNFEHEQKAFEDGYEASLDDGEFGVNSRDAVVMFNGIPQEQTTSALNHPQFVYIYELHKFLDTDTGFLNSLEKMNSLYPIEKKTWCGEFFRNNGKDAIGRTRFNKMTYMPGVATGEYEYDEYNIWQPPRNVHPVEGDISIWLELREHLFPDALVRDHITRWMAYTLQHQEVKINHAVLILGEEQGSGKDSLFEPLLHGIGSDNHTMVFPAELHGNYNDFLKGKKLLVVQEIKDYSKGELEHYLKPLLASPPNEVAISEKFVGRYKLPNIWNTLMFSNELDAVKVSKSDRRYFVVRTLAKPWPRIEELWNWYAQEDGHNKVLHYLLTLDVSDFKPKNPPPMTADKQELIEASRPPVDVGVEEYLVSHPEFQVFTLRMLESRLGDKFNLNQLRTSLRRQGYLHNNSNSMRYWYRADTPEEVIAAFKKGGEQVVYGESPKESFKDIPPSAPKAH